MLSMIMEGILHEQDRKKAKYILFLLVSFQHNLETIFISQVGHVHLKFSFKISVFRLSRTTLLLTIIILAEFAKSLQSCLTLCDPIRLPRPWDSPGKNTGVGCHFLLQCMKVKSEREVAQSCPTLSDPMDCRLPGSSIHRIFQARVLEWGCHCLL